VSLPAKKAEGRGGGAPLLFITTHKSRAKKKTTSTDASARFSLLDSLFLRFRDLATDTERLNVNLASCRRAGRHARNTSARRLSSFARVADG
jgi:hypothetical protein